MMLLFLSWFLTCNGTKWPKLCLCAVKKLLTHSLTNPTLLSFTSSSRTASTDFYLHRFFWATSVFDFYFFSLFFVSGPCARLSWPSRQLLSARKSTVSYRIVSYVIIRPWFHHDWVKVLRPTRHRTGLSSFLSFFIAGKGPAWDYVTVQCAGLGRGSVLVNVCERVRECGQGGVSRR